MLKSMTAFGRACRNVNGKEVTVEIKSVNNRFLDCSIRLPRNYTYLEESIKRRLSSAGISRGKIEINITINDTDEVEVKLQHALAKGYIRALYTLRDEFGLADDISVMTVAKNPDIFSVARPENEEDRATEAVQEALTPALESFCRMREAEGKFLSSDMCQKIERLRHLAAEVSELSAADIHSYRDRLEQKLRDVLSDNRITVDENRILTECAIFADKAAIDEELVRLESHFRAFENFIQASESPVGRKLDFLIQEMNRETNTIGSKCSNATIAHLVVDMKSELEKIREQVQNIE